MTSSSRNARGVRIGEVDRRMRHEHVRTQDAREPIAGPRRASAADSQRSNAGRERVADARRAPGRRDRTRGDRGSTRARARAGTAAHRAARARPQPSWRRARRPRRPSVGSARPASTSARVSRPSSAATGAAHERGLAVEVAVERGPGTPCLAGDVVERGLRQAEPADAREQGGGGRGRPRLTVAGAARSAVEIREHGHLMRQYTRLCLTVGVRLAPAQDRPAQQLARTSRRTSAGSSRSWRPGEAMSDSAIRATYSAACVEVDARPQEPGVAGHARSGRKYAAM